MRQEGDIPILGLRSSPHGVKLSGICLSAEDEMVTVCQILKLTEKSQVLAHCNLYFSSTPKMHEPHYYLYMAKFVQSGKEKSHCQRLFSCLAFIYGLCVQSQLCLILLFPSPADGSSCILTCTSDLFGSVFPSSASSSGGWGSPVILVKVSPASQTSCISGGLVSKQSLTMALQKWKYTGKRQEAFLIFMES